MKKKPNAKKENFFDNVQFKRINVDKSIHQYRYNIKRQKSKQDFAPNLAPENIAQIVQKSINSGKDKNAKSVFISLQGIEKIKVFELLTEQEQVYLLNRFDPLTSSEILEQADPDEAAYFLKQLTILQISKILEVMASDDVIRILDEMDNEIIEEIISNFSEENQEYYHNSLNRYLNDEAGKMMADGAIVINDSMTVDLARDLLISQAPFAETISSIFVLNENQKLVGVIDLRNLILSQKEYLIKDIMETRFVTALDNMDQEEVANLMKDYDLTVIPVVNSANELLGIITVDDALDVLEEEAKEDFEKFAGISTSDQEDDDYHIKPSLRKRVPWLVAMALMSIVVSYVIKGYEVTLAEFPYLFPFVTLINNITGITAVQVSAITTLRVNTHELEVKEKMRKFLKNQIVVIFLTAIIMALIDGTLSALITKLNGGELAQITQVFGVVATAIFIAVSVNSSIGVIAVLILNKINKDPAAASGPIMQTLGDLIAVMTYFTVIKLIVG